MVAMGTDDTVSVMTGRKFGVVRLVKDSTDKIGIHCAGYMSSLATTQADRFILEVS